MDLGVVQALLALLALLWEGYSLRDLEDRNTLAFNEKTDDPGFSKHYLKQKGEEHPVEIHAKPRIQFHPMNLSYKLLWASKQFFPNISSKADTK